MVNTPPLPRADDIDATWKYIEDGVGQVLRDDLAHGAGLSSQMYMNLYSAIHNYCVSRDSNRSVSLASRGGVGSSTRGAQLIGADLYYKLKGFLESHLSSLEAEAQPMSGGNLLLYYIKCWDKYTVGAQYINHIFNYLNRHWVKRERDDGRKNVVDVNTMCLCAWKECFFDPLEKKVIDALLEQFTRLRNGESTGTIDIRKVVYSLVSLGLDQLDIKRVNLQVYEQAFLHPFIQHTKDYYTKESALFLQENTVVDYNRKAEQRLAEEKGRVDVYLHPSSEQRVIETCHECLIADHAEVIRSEFGSLLQGYREDDIRRVHVLLSKVDGALDPILPVFESYVKQEGENAVKQLAKDLTGTVDASTYVDTLIGVYERYVHLVEVAFSNHTSLHKVLDAACLAFINKNAIATPDSPSNKSRDSKTPELLASYCNTLLKKTTKTTEDFDLEAKLENAIVIFRFLEEKDAFQKHYTRNLARRLVYNSSASDDAERSMVNKLKNECGMEYTGKLNKMFQDISVSGELQEEFKERVQQKRQDAAASGGEANLVDFSPTIIAEGCWPLPSVKDGFRLPNDLTKTYEAFTQYYQAKHQGRKLKWLWNFTKGDVKIHTKGSKIGYSVTASIYQIAILLAYNDADVLSVADLQEITGLSNTYLHGSLHLILKSKFLLVEGVSGDPKDVELTPETRIVFNQDFKSKKIRININGVIKTEAKAEAEETKKAIEEDRKWFLQATIVRVMKARKTLKHTALVQETIVQSKKRFHPKIGEIKKVIDDLIEREYLTRIEQDKYEYAA
ncbi:Cullin [Yarrowia lipolytica]|jgi:cullin 1|uniref:YALI0D12518p n=2 Tax=Yarrowia lipolytica TaxID=4952 RepID=Q6C9B4_YARLI|nr:YALI0D12518p [Yarrowia lipolytica CLIB122]AOW03975.1 hypothetical protein YALI1_D15622g [Yarrowia lipolytica]KAB8285198.1 Cullin [Yarrowia lipolytica]KAE8171244.1 Cullin [Yarrowia lipolytica]KAJ8054462.1 Cullin [Yarrowia lipolytica]QNP97812.1 Cullin-1 [Yarrowia lipolytica]|eukprot:XP_502748.1 YALI0D12518p [Yarrowia lipolytica CLIB122]